MRIHMVNTGTMRPGRERWVDPATGYGYAEQYGNVHVVELHQHADGSFHGSNGDYIYVATGQCAACGVHGCMCWMVSEPPVGQAFKSDAGKPDFDLLMSGAPNALLGVVKVLSWAVAPKPMAPWPDGGKGYVPHSWQQVPEAKRRYRAALLRHQNAVARGELTDDESGLSHWYHIATNALFLAELETIQEVK